jgi:ankyrin repeat protein
MSYAVHEALILGQPDILKCILEHRSYNPSALLTTVPLVVNLAIYKRFGILEHLLQYGIDINITFGHHVSTMVAAVRSGNTELVKTLVEHGYRFDEECVLLDDTILWSIINTYSEVIDESNMTKTLTFLIQLGADVNANVNEVPILHDAVIRGDIKMVEVLGSLGADMNIPGHRGTSLLKMVLYSNYIKFDEYKCELLKIIVDAGADVNSSNETLSPLFLAIERQDKAMVETLAKLGADMNGCMFRGIKPLHLAFQLDAGDFLEYLVKSGADLNSEEEYDVEPLAKALELNDWEMVKCLLKCGASPGIGEHRRKMKLIHGAIERGDTDMLSYLIQAGASLDTLDRGNGIPVDIKTLLSPETWSIAEGFGIHTVNQPMYSSLTKCIKVGGNADMFQMLLLYGVNESYIPNVEYGTEILKFGLNDMVKNIRFQYSNLHAACDLGELDFARLLIFDGSDVNERDSTGNLPFDLLPLAYSAGYNTLRETRTTEKVVERIGLDFEPYVLCEKMETLLCTPVIGDVHCIEGGKSVEICDEVQMAVCKIIERYEFVTSTNTRLRRVGSSAEGTKVGFPDEMDFLVEVGKAEEANMNDAGHGFVHYVGQSSRIYKEGSKWFHVHFAARLCAAVTVIQHSFVSDSLSVTSHTLGSMISDVKRGATSPLVLIWSGTGGHFKISIDVVPSLLVQNWPADGVSKTWLLGPAELKQHGYYLVTKPPHVNSGLAKFYDPEELPKLWKISFAHLETYHMQRLEKRIKDVYVLAKCLRNPDVCRLLVTDEGSLPKNADKYITSYMLKMIFLKNVEDFLHSDLSLGEMVCRVYDGVEEGLSKGFIPLFFMPKVNALGGLKLNIAKSAKVARIMKKFVHALYMRDCCVDGKVMGDEEEIVLHQRKPTSVYRSIEIGNGEDKAPKMDRPGGKDLSMDKTLDEIFDWKCVVL